MNEQFLQYIWKNKLLKTKSVTTKQGDSVDILDFGKENKDAGPDFLNSKIKIDNILWAGNVEIHVNRSDWYKHNHHKDENYKNIILHVVYKDDIDENASHLANIPTLEINNLFDKELYYKYQTFIQSKNWIPCQHNLNDVQSIIVMNWLNRLLVERLERKAEEIEHYLNFFKNDWLETLYFFLSKNFGFKKNSTGFEMLAKSLPYKILSKHRDQILQLEALLFGQAGLLKESYTESYPKELLKEYSFLRKKYNLKPIDPKLWKFSKLRPPNFPTIRLSQFAHLIHASENLWEIMVKSNEPAEIRKLLDVKASKYWDDHYVFEKISRGKPKKLGESCIDSILINTIGPVMFVYGKQTINQGLCEKALHLFSEIKPENNSIITNWTKNGIKSLNAADTQALIELKKNYCTPKKCLQCAIGNALLKKTLS